jgi:hypothetical protein
VGTSNLVTSPHAVCYINSIPFARCSGVSYSVSSPSKQSHGIDTLLPIEQIPLGLSVSGDLQVYKLKIDGGAEAAGLIATWNKMTRSKHFSLMVLDRSTDSVILRVDHCHLNNQTWQIQPKQFVVGTFAWAGLDYSNESE